MAGFTSRVTGEMGRLRDFSEFLCDFSEFLGGITAPVCGFTTRRSDFTIHPGG